VDGGKLELVCDEEDKEQITKRKQTCTRGGQLIIFEDCTGFAMIVSKRE
jgi:hypothetical protein